MHNCNNLIFSEAPDSPIKTSVDNWKVLIVDDESSVHDVTKLALSGFEFDSKGLEFLHAYSKRDAINIMQQHNDIALALVDVVMEEEHAGLNFVDHVRNTMNNNLIRIVLRTGQPGQAPEREVLKKYDINDYKEKTELTSKKLFSTVYTSIRSFRDISALSDNRKGLERVIKSSTEIYKISNLTEFINGVLQQLVAVLYLDRDTVYLSHGAMAVEGVNGQSTIIAGTGKYTEHVNKTAENALLQEEKELIEDAIKCKNFSSDGTRYAMWFSPEKGFDDVLLFSTAKDLSDDDIYILRMFFNNVGVAYKNILLNNELEDTQREILYMLGEAIETRSRETGSHVRRVAEYSRLLAKYYGLSKRELELIMLASPLHDFGKIGIPDKILHKQGKLDEDEWEQMKYHSALGEEMLSRSNREVMQAAAIIAGQHHEWWDGTGYPRGKSGKDIHIYARITALADVYDALASKRCYKEPWPLKKIYEYISGNQGLQFEPGLVDILMNNKNEFQAIHLKYPDQ